MLSIPEYPLLPPKTHESIRARSVFKNSFMRTRTKTWQNVPRRTRAEGRVGVWACLRVTVVLDLRLDGPWSSCPCKAPPQPPGQSGRSRGERAERITLELTAPVWLKHGGRLAGVWKPRWVSGFYGEMAPTRSHTQMLVRPWVEDQQGTKVGTLNNHDCSFCAWFSSNFPEIRPFWPPAVCRCVSCCLFLPLYVSAEHLCVWTR